MAASGLAFAATLSAATKTTAPATAAAAATAPRYAASARSAFTPARPRRLSSPRRPRHPAPPRRRTAPRAAAAPPGVETLRHALVDACLHPSLDRGLGLDPDAEAETAAEEAVEDLAERLEDANACAAPTASPDMSGSWDLLYTSSTLTRFHGGLSGMHKYVDGTVGRITQEIDTETGICTFYEQIAYALPVLNKAAQVTVTVTGRIRAVNETRQMWAPETISASWFKLWAESWKSVRAFAIAETTYLDRDLRITRGQTGSLTIYGRTQPAK